MDLCLEFNHGMQKKNPAVFSLPFLFLLSALDNFVNEMALALYEYCHCLLLFLRLAWHKHHEHQQHQQHQKTLALAAYRPSREQGLIQGPLHQATRVHILSTREGGSVVQVWGYGPSARV